jgi:hypothetical protein
MDPYTCHTVYSLRHIIYLLNNVYIHLNFNKVIMLLVGGGSTKFILNRLRMNHVLILLSVPSSLFLILQESGTEPAFDLKGGKIVL